MTSPEALATLRKLPKTNPSLYKQFTSDCEDIGDETEPAFSAENDAIDDSDIPIDVVALHIVQEDLGEGFEADSDGRIERTGVAEDVDAERSELVDAPLILGRGKRVKLPSTRYTSAWEQH